MALQDVLVPDIGNFDSVDVIDVLVKAGGHRRQRRFTDHAGVGQGFMDIPAPFAGVVKEVKMKVGDKAAQGGLILVLDASDAAPAAEKTCRTTQRHAHGFNGERG